MKKIIKLKESQLYKLIKNIITESDLPELQIGDFHKIVNNKYELKDTGNAIEYVGVETLPPPKYEKKPRVRFIIRFYKKPENNRYKVQILSPDTDNNRFGSEMANWIDETIINKFKELGVDFGAQDRGESTTVYEKNMEYYSVIYYVEMNEMEEFKKIIYEFLERYGV